METLSAVGRSAWIDLLRTLKDSALSGLIGTPKKKTVGARQYWYDHYRLGSRTVDRYIGEDSDELRARLARHRKLAAEEKTRERTRARLMRILRAEGFRMSDVNTGQIVSAMAKTGVFRLGGTLVGTTAFLCYEGELGVRIGFDAAAQTDDIDIASFERLSLVIEDRVDTPLAQVFGDLKFDPVPSLDRRHVWRWRQTDRQTMVEFLTPSFSGDEGLRTLEALGVSAQGLHHLNYLIAEPIQVPFLYRYGSLVQVPRPERFAIHKLIVADRRRDGPDSGKAAKDRAQAAFLVEVLAEERPVELADAYQTALESGPAWRTRIAASLARMPQTARRLDAL
ncbi:GSU2403 family nucleotidyltransferase fold protein [Sulfitobacter sp. D35]|uniref:nucleotidyltransferase family protein n=1 Tax=Sulfitobacter sp. D35 TaxID=3083252 RepID=UPI00296E445F|nr:GSU2403 family nucleotidyltransferase fold protein [Sulfitobacter sp. D35]MDW4499310.1 GSU2403 family nucleotidyltransferase fold protein [Sulfitobacter sp. D35]